MSYVDLPPISPKATLEELYQMLEEEKEALRSTSYPSIIAEGIDKIESEIRKREELSQ